MTNLYKNFANDFLGADWLIEKHPQAYNRNSLSLGIPIDLDTSYYTNTIPSGYPIHDTLGVGTAIPAGDLATKVHGLLLYDVIDRAGESYFGSFQKVAVIEAVQEGVTNQRNPAFPRPVITFDLLPKYDLWGTQFDEDVFRTSLEALGFLLK